MIEINEIIYYFAIYLVIMNVFSFTIIYIDKNRAKKNAFRISERFLILLSVFGGTYGIIYSMLMFRHKTLHKKFYIGVPLIQIIHIILCYYILIEILQNNIVIN